MNLVIGTAQFYKNYGVSNKTGITSQKEINKIIKFCNFKKISYIDTAIGYDDVDIKLGKNNLENFKIITKIPNLKKNKLDQAFLDILKSKKRLNIKCFHGILLHRPNQLVKNKNTWIVDFLKNLKDLKLTNKIGISLSSNEDFKIIKYFKPDIIQAPYNPFDDFLNQYKIRRKLKNTEIYLRSIFLQGLLLMNNNNRPKYFKKWVKEFNKWDNEFNNLDEKIDYCIKHALSYGNKSKIIMGINNLSQLENNVNQFIKLKKNKKLINKFSNHDKNLINPSRWKLYEN